VINTLSKRLKSFSTQCCYYLFVAFEFLKSLQHRTAAGLERGIRMQVFELWENVFKTNLINKPEVVESWWLNENSVLLFSFKSSYTMQRTDTAARLYLHSIKAKRSGREPSNTWPQSKRRKNERKEPAKLMNYFKDKIEPQSFDWPGSKNWNSEAIYLSKLTKLAISKLELLINNWLWNLHTTF